VVYDDMNIIKLMIQDTFQLKLKCKKIILLLYSIFKLITEHIKKVHV